MHAVEAKRGYMVDFLCARGADPNAQDLVSMCRESPKYGRRLAWQCAEWKHRTSQDLFSQSCPQPTHRDGHDHISGGVWSRYARC